MKTTSALAVMASLTLAAAPVAARPAAIASAPSVNPAQSLSLSPSVRRGAPSRKGEKFAGLTGTQLAIGAAMIALGAGAIVLAVDDNNDNNSDSN